MRHPIRSSEVIFCLMASVWAIACTKSDDGNIPDATPLTSPRIILSRPTTGDVFEEGAKFECAGEVVVDQKSWKPFPNFLEINIASEPKFRNILLSQTTPMTPGADPDTLAFSYKRDVDWSTGGAAECYLRVMIYKDSDPTKRTTAYSEVIIIEVRK